MKTKNILVVNQYNDHLSNIGILETISEIKFYTDPYLLLSNLRIPDKYDGILLYDVDIDTYLKYSLLNRKICGTYRADKLHQQQIFNRYGLITPLYLGLNVRDIDKNIFLGFAHALFQKSRSNKLLVKVNDGARGIGQICVYEDQLGKFFSDNLNLDKDVFYEKYQDQIGGHFESDFEKYHLQESINSGNFFLSELLEDIENEYRILWFKNGHHMIFDRHIKKGKHFNQANLGDGDIKHEHLDISLKALLGDDIFKKIETLTTELNVPFLSIDAYSRKNKQIGFFEFQMQFGIDSICNAGLEKEYLNNMKESILQTF